MDSPETSRLNKRKLPNIRLRLVERTFVWMLRGLRYGRLQIIFPSGACEFVGEHAEPVLELHIKHDLSLIHI